MTPLPSSLASSSLLLLRLDLPGVGGLVGLVAVAVDGTRTSSVCLPFFFFTFSFSGELQGMNFLPSRLHSNLALASSEEGELGLGFLRLLLRTGVDLDRGRHAVVGASRVLRAAVLGLVAVAVAVGIGLDRRRDVGGGITRAVPNIVGPLPGAGAGVTWWLVNPVWLTALATVARRRGGGGGEIMEVSRPMIPTRPY